MENVIEIEIEGILGKKKGNFSTIISHETTLYTTILLSQILKQYPNEDADSVAKRESTFINLIKNRLLSEQFSGGDSELISDHEYSYDAGLDLYNKLQNKIFRQNEDLKKN